MTQTAEEHQYGASHLPATCLGVSSLRCKANPEHLSLLWDTWRHYHLLHATLPHPWDIRGHAHHLGHEKDLFGVHKEGINGLDTIHYL